jgi:hypothetical protein
MDRVPLSVLLSKALDALSRELDARRGDEMPRVAVWANVLQYLDESGIDQKELARRSRLTKRALPPVLTPLKAGGYVAIENKQVRLTSSGRTASEGWPSMLADGERRWRRRLGAENFTMLRAQLERVVSQFELHHADFPTSYGPSDPRIRGGPGRDWKPTPRPAGSSSGQPITALLSQAVVEFVSDYETVGGPMQWAANVFRFVPDTGVAVSALPDTTWLGKMIHHGFLTVSASKEAVYLSSLSRQLQLRDSYLPTVVAIEDQWRTRFGSDTIEGLRTILERFVRQLDPNDQLPHLLSLSRVWADARWADPAA